MDVGGTPGPREEAPVYRIDCRGRRAAEILTDVLPICRRTGAPPTFIIDRLDMLEDSVARLLKAFDRIADDFGARITLADSSGFGDAFLEAMSGNVHLSIRRS
jgi:hypothetical protein